MALKRLRLTQRRKALGYTQEGLAGQLGCERTTIIRWERAETEPQPWLRPKLAQVLQLTPQELHALLDDVADVPDKGDGFALVSTVPLDFSLSAAYTVRVLEGFSAHDIASRREALASLAVITGAALLRPIRQWAAALTPLPGSPPEVGSDEVSELEQAVMLFRRWDASGAGGLRRKAVVGQLNATAESLNTHQPPEIIRRLFQVTAELAQLAGWMAYDQGLSGTAQRYYLLALHACREGTDEPRTWQHYSTKAEVHSLRARHSRGEGYVRSRIFDEIRLAKVRLAQREPAEAATVGLHALQLADDTRSSLVVDWLIRFDRTLIGRYPDVPEAGIFHEQLRHYLRKAVPQRASELP